MSDEQVKFNVKGITEPAKVPGWARRELKYEELKNVVRSLQAGQTIIIEFENVEAAEHARNVVRDDLNAEIGAAAYRTRMVKQTENGKPEVYFSKLHPVDIVESED